MKIVCSNIKIVFSERAWAESVMGRGLGATMVINVKTVLRSSAFALCAIALTSIAQPAPASTLDFGGPALTIGPSPFYSGSPSSNNVINSPSAPSTGSVLTDPTGPNLTANTPWVMNGFVSTTLTNYAVNWFYAGSESGYAITFSAIGLTGGMGPFTENNNNNSCSGSCASSGTTAPVFMGMTTNSLAFTLSWATGSVTNNGSTTDPNPTPGNGIANLIFSFLQPNSGGPGFTLTILPTNWFAFALNDNGSGDDDHDDFVGFGQIIPLLTGQAGTTPIPATLSLFGSVIAGGLALGAWRKRRKRRGKARQLIA
jgi:hypothetical protein